jgi:hypothetical protein
MRRAKTIFVAVLLVSGLCVSGAQAYGGGGFYGSGRSVGFSASDRADISEMKSGRYHRALDLAPFEDSNYPSTSDRDFEMPPSAHGG